MADTWTPISGYTPQDYTDTAVFAVDPDTKKIALITGQALVAGEENAQYIKFILDRYWDGIDIKDKAFYVEYALAGTYYGKTAVVNAEYNDEKVRFGWVVPKEACCISGTLLFVLRIESTEYVLKTQIAEHPVFKSVNVEDVVPEPTKEAWYREFEARVETAIDDAETALTAAQAAQTAAENAALNAQTSEENAETAAAMAQTRYGSPLTAAEADEMIEQNRVYVYVGNETGYTYGHWYYYNGTEWADGGAYNGSAVNTDTTLTQSGMAADAKATGDAIDQIKEDFTDISASIKSELGHRYGDGETTTETQSAYYITGTYGVVKPLGSGNTNYKVERYAVTAGDVYRISGSVYGNTSLYSFYDANNTPLKWYNDGVGSGFRAVTNVIDIAPSGAVYLYVAHIIGKGDALVEKRLNGWTGLKWSMMGDSITDSNNARATKRYFDYISEMTGITTVNLGKSGTGYKKDYNSNLPFYQRVDTIPTDSDVITIFGSGNDCSLTLGTPTDATADTVCGCINLTIDGIRDRIVGANIGIITPTPWVQYPTTTIRNNMDLYCDALVEICRLKGVPCLDLYHCSNMLPWEEDFRNAFYKHDDGNGVHPDEDGHKLFAPRIKAFLESLLM